MSIHRERIGGFDGLRAVAFFMVFVSHKVSTPRSEALGTAGVWLFFVLSGFLITRILSVMREEIEAGSATVSGAIKAFYLRRTARIMPVYYAFLVILTLFALAGSVELGDPRRQISYWLYLTNFYIERHGWATDLGHLWSLAVEEQFYLVFAPVALLIARRRLPEVCLGLIGVSLSWHLVLWAMGAATVSFDVDSIVNLGLLALGGLAGLSVERPLPRHLAGDVAVAMVLVTYVALPLVVVDTGLWLPLGRLSGFLAALLLIQIVQCPDCLLVRLLEVRFLREIGLVSYGAYLIHPVIHADDVLPFFGIDISLDRSAQIGLELLLALLAAQLSWRLFERPVGARLRSIDLQPARTPHAPV